MSQPALSFAKSIRGILLVICLILPLPDLMAQASNGIAAAEQQDFDAAVQAFQDQLLNYQRAEEGFTSFVERWPQSRLAQAAKLYLAQARHHRGNHLGAVKLLSDELPSAGRWADQYQFWIGESWFAAEEYEQAANSFAKLLFIYQYSDLRFRASYGEALARRRLNQFSDVISLLENPAGPFRLSAALRPDDRLNSSGHLLLAETRLEINDLKGTQAAMNKLKGWELDAEQRWQRQYLLCRLALEAGEPNGALTATTNLVDLAEKSGLAEAEAQTFHLQSGILERLQRLDEAVSVLTKNLTSGTPARFKREALLKLVHIHKDRKQFTSAITMLDKFSHDNTNDPALPLVYRTVGETRLDQYHFLPATKQSTATGTDLLKQATTNFTRALRSSDYFRGQSTFNRGWCHWHLGHWSAAAKDFATATSELPLSESHAVAKYKLAECQLRLNDVTNAVANLKQLVEDYRRFGPLRHGLLDQALYKLLTTASSIGDLELAEESVQHLLNWYPESYFGDRSLILFGQALFREDHPSKARDSFQSMIDRFPNSKLVSQVQIALARTHEHERNWSAAADQLVNWARRFPGDPLLPDVEYERAWLTYQSGNPDQAFQLYTNFIHHFPTHTNAPLAEKWVGDYYSNQGKYVKAQERYQLLYENPKWDGTRLKYESHLAAGQAALAGKRISEATNTFIELLNNPKLPKDIEPEVLFALGDSFSLLEDHGQAINAFSRITAGPQNRLSAYALGRIGDSHFQLSAKDPTRLQKAADAYKQAIQLPKAEAPARTLAEYGLAQVLEEQKGKKNHLNEAVTHYSNILYRKNLHPHEPVSFNVIRDAGYAIARIQESRGAFGEAIKVYERITTIFPSLGPILKLRIERAQKLAAARVHRNSSPPLTGKEPPISLSPGNGNGNGN